MVAFADLVPADVLMTLSRLSCFCLAFYDTQGVTLARPEIVPFRLTPSMVDGMGLCGFEGVYRRVMEACIHVLRTNRETLLSVLEPFLQVSSLIFLGPNDDFYTTYHIKLETSRKRAKVRGWDGEG